MNIVRSFADYLQYDLFENAMVRYTVVIVKVHFD